jgi:hypothetical protein
MISKPLAMSGRRLESPTSGVKERRRGVQAMRLALQGRWRRRSVSTPYAKPHEPSSNGRDPAPLRRALLLTDRRPHHRAWARSNVSVS